MSDKPEEQKPAKAEEKKAEETPTKAEEKKLEQKPAAAPPKPAAAAPPKPAAAAPPKPAAAAPPKPAAAAPPAKEPPKFEKSIVDKIEQKFGPKIKTEFIKETRIRIKVAKEDVLEVAKYIRDDLHYDHAESVTGVDYPDQKEIEVVYHLGSYTEPALAKQILTLATRAPREDVPDPGNDKTKLPSLRDIFYSVEFHERECFEMLGVYFEGHPDNRRLLLPEDWADIPPLRRDFAIKGR